MSQLSHDPIKTRILLVVGLILLAVIGISTWSMVSEYRVAIDAAEKIAQGYSRALAENSDSAFSEADGMLRELQRDIRNGGGLGSVDGAEVVLKMRSQTTNARQMGVMFAADARGVMRLNSGSSPFQALSVADRDYFSRYLATPGLQLSFGSPVQSRLTGHWRFNLVRPLAPPGAPFGGIVAAGFNTEFFSSFFSPGTLGPRGRAVLVGTDGVPLMSAPHDARAYRLDYRHSVLFREKLPGARSGIYQAQNELTNDQPMIVSYHRLERYPVVAAVLLNRNDVLAPWARKAATQSALVLGLCLVIVILTRLIFSHLDRLRLALGTVDSQKEQLSIKAAQIDAVSDAILQIDTQGRLVHFNQALCVMTGYQASELAGFRLHDIEPPENAEHILPNLELIRERGQATFESAYLTKEGAVVPIEVEARMVESRGRSLVLSVARDITRRKRIEARESARLAILEKISTGAPLDALLLDIVRFVELEIPGALCSVLVADETGTRLRLGVAPSLPEAYIQALDSLKIAQGMGPFGAAVFQHQRVVIEDREALPFRSGFPAASAAGLVSCWSEPVFSAEGGLLGTIAIYHRVSHSPREDELQLGLSAAHLASIAIGRLRDEESREALEEKLGQIQKIEAVGQLAAGIAHDFNNLLTPICVYADLIREGFPEGDPQLKMIDSVLLAAHKASDLTRKLLSFGRKQVLCMEVLDLNEVIVSFGDIMRTSVRESVAIALQLAPGQARVLADRGQLEQILLNLAVNAQDAIEGNGAITVETGHLVLDAEYAKLHPGVKPGPYVLLAFSDDGSGMDEATLRRIYEPFFTTKELGRGTGLGLATVYGLIKQHEGFIEAISQPGVGTTFRVFLPMSQLATVPQAALHTGPVARQAVGAGRTVLLVEDDLMLREMAGDLLAQYGYHPLVAATPWSALELAARHKGAIHLLVTDVVLPQMNGPELYGRLLESCPQLPVLFMSGYGGNVVPYQDAPEVEIDFLSKPFTLEQFLERVQHMLSV